MVASCRAVRHRRDLIAATIDETCAARPGARILSVACGHLREAALSDAVMTGALSTLIALDMPVHSGTGASSPGSPTVSALPMSLRVA
jgi:hypothetical protein